MSAETPLPVANTRVQRDINIVNKLGLHARAAAKLVTLASSFDSNIVISKDNRKADAKSIMSIMMLAASKGMVIQIEAQGKDAEEAVSQIRTLFGNRFGEPE